MERARVPTLQKSRDEDAANLIRGVLIATSRFPYSTVIHPSLFGNVGTALPPIVT
jgi:hypothetical protein